MCDQPGGERLKAYTPAKLVQSGRVQNSSSTLAGTSLVHRYMEKRDLVQCLLDPLRPSCMASPCGPLTGRVERG